MSCDSMTRTKKALQKHAMNLCEYFVLCSVHYRIGASPEELANHSQWASEGDPRGSCTHDEHISAVQSCMKKGMLKRISRQDYHTEIKRLQHSQAPEIDDPGLSVGAVDFTQNGYTIFRQILCDIFGREHVKQDDAGWNHNDQKKRFELYAETEELCASLLNNFVEQFDMYIGEPATVINIENPCKIGHWKPNRFITIPTGFRAYVYYKIL